MSFRLPFWACSAFVATCSVPSLAQELEQVDVFRDAAVVTWRANGTNGSGTLARSFHSNSPADAMVFPTAADGQWGALGARRATWPAENADPGFSALTANLENARLELALKNAQLALAEEDIALLRANRQVTGTSEALLVEDLAEVADWMHDEMKDLLFRRVELNLEIAEQEKAVQALEKKVQSGKVRTAFYWEADGLALSDGLVRTQVVEWGGGQHWSPQDMLSLSSAAESPLLTWYQRAMVSLDVPYAGKGVSVMFHDAPYAGLRQRPDAESVPVMAYSREMLSKGGDADRSNPSSNSKWPGTHWTLADMEVGPQWDRNVPLGQETLPAVVRHFSVPKQSPVVNMRIAVPRPAMPVAQADQALLMIDGRPAGKVWLTESGDSLLIDAGVSRDWTVERKRESALCAKSTLGNRIKHHRAFSITVANRSSHAGAVVIDEPLPVSKSAEIEVAPETLGGGTLDQASGIVRWTLDLEAGESRTIQFSYDLSHGRDQRVPDLD
jgi:hypothetical protein